MNPTDKTDEWDRREDIARRAYMAQRAVDAIVMPGCKRAEQPRAHFGAVVMQVHEIAVNVRQRVEFLHCKLVGPLPGLIPLNAPESPHGETNPRAMVDVLASALSALRQASEHLDVLVKEASV